MSKSISAEKVSQWDGTLPLWTQATHTHGEHTRSRRVMHMGGVIVAAPLMPDALKLLCLALLA